ncbi:MAG TPA: CocE/NonD family hydrolase [Solirubrobacteraceae bacterium]|nr:CocE/NonD family hydrolase [Solirubrobacteraceae bacterium]
MRPAGGVSVEFDVPAQMRDGVTLRANVYRPEGGGPWPTLLNRTPYGKDAAEEWLDPVQAARRGFMVVVQDTRGRFASDGEWMPLTYERNDGYDTVEWAAKLPGSSGRVGMYGASYFGNTQWMAAIEQPPSLAAIAPAVTWSDPLDGLFARGGAVELGVTPGWSLMMGAGNLLRSPLSDEERSERLQTLIDDIDALPTDGYWSLPIHDLAVLRRHQAPELGTLRTLDDPSVAADCTVAGHYERVGVPSFHIGGWYDIFTQGVLDSYTAMAAQGKPARLVMGPWTHDSPLSDPLGDLCFGARCDRFAPAYGGGDLSDAQLAWFQRQLVPGADAQTEQAPVQIFVMGRNIWRQEPSWPLARARTERWFLGPDGDLRQQVPDAGAAPSEFTYDPADPVPTVGGNTVITPAYPAGPHDQTLIEARRDVCVYTSQPLQDDLEVTGRVRVVLHAESSAPSTDWVARLCDVHPDGRSFNLCDGIVRIAEGADACREIAIDLWSTSNVFLAGHRLRVHVSSSSFPRWDRNLNTGNQREPALQVARQCVRHDAQHASWIELPVVDSDNE